MMIQNQVRIRHVAPVLKTPIYSKRLQIGILDHRTKRITLYHSPYPYYVHSTQPGAVVFDHVGRRVGQLGFNGQLHRSDSTA